jgi:hypothetical protein
LGWTGVLATLLFYVTPILGIVLCLAVLLYAFTMVFVYTDLFAFLWPKKISENVYSVQEPKDGAPKFTIILGAHYDSSWHWTTQYKNPKTFLPKLGLGLLSFFVLLAASITLTAKGDIRPIWTAAIEYSAAPWSATRWAMVILPAVVAPCYAFIIRFLSHNKKLASPGAMDNLSGIALNLELAEHYAKNPEELKGARLITVAFGCEEAGLKGSMAFVKKHLGEDILKNAYFINIDSVSDADYFEAVGGDLMQMTRFDPELIEMTYQSIKETGVLKSKGKIINPVGGCDSTPFAKAGIPTVTIAAQNPVPTNYYHTKDDKPERLSTEVFANGLEIVKRVIEKIVQKETGKSNG